MKIKYPKTMHLPWSRGYTDDDKILRNTDHFTGQEVVITEKMDGRTPRCTPVSFMRDRWTARIILPSLCEDVAWGIKYLIPEGYRLCGKTYMPSIRFCTRAVLLHAVLRVE